MSASLRFQQSMRADVLGTVRMGKSFDALLRPGAKVLDVQTSGNRRTTDYDLNGDGKSDLILSETLGADGKVIGRSFDVFEAGGRSFIAYDNNNDGKIDAFSRQARGEYDYFGDTNRDGKTDDQSVTHVHKGRVTSSHAIIDTNHDGKADLYSAGKPAKKGQAVAKALTLPTVGDVLGKSVASVLAGATQLDSMTSNGARAIDYDLDGDGKADLSEYDFLDASGNVSSRSLTVIGQGASFSDTNHDGTIDDVSLNQADGSSLSQFDANGDGKVDNNYVWAKDGSYSDQFDENHDGFIDWISSTKKI